MLVLFTQALGKLVCRIIAADLLSVKAYLVHEIAFVTRSANIRPASPISHPFYPHMHQECHPHAAVLIPSCFTPCGTQTGWCNPSICPSAGLFITHSSTTTWSHPLVLTLQLLLQLSSCLQKYLLALAFNLSPASSACMAASTACTSNNHMAGSKASPPHRHGSFSLCDLTTKRHLPC